MRSTVDTRARQLTWRARSRGMGPAAGPAQATEPPQEPAPVRYLDNAGRGRAASYRVDHEDAPAGRGAADLRDPSPARDHPPRRPLCTRVTRWLAVFAGLGAIGMPLYLQRTGRDPGPLLPTDRDPPPPSPTCAPGLPVAEGRRAMPEVLGVSAPGPEDLPLQQQILCACQRPGDFASARHEPETLRAQARAAASALAELVGRTLPAAPAGSTLTRQEAEEAHLRHCLSLVLEPRASDDRWITSVVQQFQLLEPSAEGGLALPRLRWAQVVWQTFAAHTVARHPPAGAPSPRELALGVLTRQLHALETAAGATSPLASAGQAVPESRRTPLGGPAAAPGLQAGGIAAPPDREKAMASKPGTAQALRLD